MSTVITAEARINGRDGLSAILDKIARKIDQFGRSMKRSLEVGQQAKGIDRLAGAYDGARKSAQSLSKVKLAKEVDATAKAAKRLEDVQPLRKFSAELARDIKTMDLTRGQLRGLAREYVRMQDAQAKAISGIGNPRIRQQVLDQDRGRIDEMLRQRARRHRAERRLQREIAPDDRRGPGLPEAVAGAATGYGAQRLVRHTARKAADDAREGSRDYLAGLTPTDEKRLRDASYRLSGRYRSVEATTLHESLRDVGMSMGSVDKALAVGDTVAQQRAVLQSLKGKERATTEQREFFKALDTMGRNRTPEEVRRFADAYTKAIGVEGADLDMGGLKTAARMGKSGFASLSERFLFSIAPALMQDMGDHRFGTAIGSMVSQIVGGRATPASKKEQQKLGLRDKKGKFLDQDLLLSDPFAYSEKRLIPALQKSGVNPEDSTALTAALSRLFSNQVVADLFGKIIGQREQYKRKEEQYDRAPGLSAAEEVPKKDPYVAAQAAVSQLNNTLTILSEAAAPAATSALNLFAEQVAKLNKAAQDNPETVKKAGTYGAAFGAGPAAWGLGGILQAMAGKGDGVVANTMRLLGQGSSWIGRAVTRVTGPIGLLTALGETIAGLEQQFPRTEQQRAKGPGSKTFGKAIRQDQDEVAAKRNDGFDGARDDMIARERGIERLREHLKSSGLTGGSMGRHWLGKADQALESAQNERYDMEERRREANRGRGQRAANPLDPLPGTGGGTVQAQLSGSAEVSGQVKVENVITASSALLQVVETSKSLYAQVKGALNANGGAGGASKGTTMPQYASPSP